MNNTIINAILYGEGETINEFCETYNITQNEFNEHFKYENGDIYIKANQKCELILSEGQWPYIKFDNLIFDLALDKNEINNYIK